VCYSIGGMRAFPTAAAVFTIVLCISAQERAPNTTPPTDSGVGSGIGKLNTGQKANSSKQTGTAKPQVAPRTQAAPCYVIEQPQAKSKEQQAKDDSLDVLYRRYMLATIFGVVGAFVGIGILIWQTVLIRRSANAAIIAAKVARDTLYLTQAADVHIEGVNIYPKSPLSSSTVITVAVKNHGRTKAKKFTNDLTLGIKGQTTRPSDPRVDIEVEIGAGQPFEIGFDPLGKNFNPRTLAMILEGKIRLQFWGTIRYRDIFGRGYVIDCEGTYNHLGPGFYIDRNEHREESDYKAN
jgi:hypothetical protein